MTEEEEMEAKRFFRMAYNVELIPWSAPRNMKRLLWLEELGLVVCRPWRGYPETLGTTKEASLKEPALKASLTPLGQAYRTMLGPI